eukprot:CAMPEP_0204133750 /NCGR_PEP_ID=MMETSP0361-20130328/15277_1 /ASSEMBLY_ACC=CAM_ASM_000343 /TAXON_ID=268821 /ORGANISM="Scrippsiella Hangoei, Strain SHTV-5" /LENGTH=133 /DNA_ID=CAMNT_0051086847 /DNA_START=54 /DNA_END=453 /DNA_ORIENTATION=-
MARRSIISAAVLSALLAVVAGDAVAALPLEDCAAAGLAFCEAHGRCLRTGEGVCPSMEEVIDQVRALEESFEGGDYQAAFWDGGTVATAKAERGVVAAMPAAAKRPLAQQGPVEDVLVEHRRSVEGRPSAGDA